MLASGIILSLNMGSFSRFFTHRAMLLIWNHDLIRFSNSRWKPRLFYTRVVCDPKVFGTSPGSSIQRNPNPSFDDSAEDKRTQFIPIQHWWMLGIILDRIIW